MKYFFILGHNQTLSIAEIINVKPINKSVKISHLSYEVLILETKEKLNVYDLQKRLGGTIKIGYIIQASPDLESLKIDLFLNELKRRNKVFFGFSLYRIDEKSKIDNLKFKIKNLALKIKKKLKEKGISSRWVESKELKLSSVIVQKNKLLREGAEFCLFLNDQSILIGKTLTCQEFEEYQWQDYGRPIRKIKKGLIPPKLAKIMINLGKVPENGLILDPFCGSGTILQEAILIGYQKIIGSDISQEAVNNTKKNLEWLATKIKDKKQKIKNIIKNLKVFQSDVRNLSQKIPFKSIDAIVTEPYLGPTKIFTLKSRILNLINELSNLYLEAFKEFKKILKPKGKIVIIFPVFKIENQLHFLPILDELKKMGWQIVNPFPKKLEKSPVIRLTDRNSIIYSRPDQKVLREILIFKAKLI